MSNPNRPAWMQPMMYTNDVNPSHYQQGSQPAGQPQQYERTAEDVEALFNGESERMGRPPVPDLGDGRPGQMVDHEPINYGRGPQSERLIDLDDRDDNDFSTPEYVAPPKPQPKMQPPARPNPVPQGGPNTMTLELRHAPHEHVEPLVNREGNGTTPTPQPPKTTAINRFDLELVGILPRHDGEPDVTMKLNGELVTITISDMRIAADKLTLWCKAFCSIRT